MRLVGKSVNIIRVVRWVQLYFIQLSCMQGVEKGVYSSMCVLQDYNRQKQYV